ncbi:MAG: prenyltransferase [Candidatus Micrarchaeota archaeon]|nr:prenyltransferase [Candidatus Micrarchaeota archaeon]
MRSKFNDYVSEVLEPTLLLAFLISLVGIAAAASYGGISYANSFLVVVGSVLAQMSVNLTNDYHDYASGLDRESAKTKFSGGSRLVASGAVKHKDVLFIGIAAAAIAGIIGLYLAFAVSLWILALIAIGAVAIFAYTKYITRFPLLPEPFVMFAFVLVGMGSYAVAHGSFTGIYAALPTIIPAGVLGGIALLANEVPDAEIDKKFGRRHAVIVFNSNRKTSAYYIGLEAFTYALVLYGVIRSILNPFFLLVFVTLPVAAYVGVGIMKYRNPQSYEKYMAANITAIFVYQALLVIAYSL